MENQKLPPFDRLKVILSEDEKPTLTDKASKNLNSILGIEEKYSNTFFENISIFFKKIDSYIFKKSSRQWNTEFHRRRKGN